MAKFIIVVEDYFDRDAEKWFARCKAEPTFESVAKKVIDGNGEGSPAEGIMLAIAKTLREHTERSKNRGRKLFVPKPILT